MHDLEFLFIKYFEQPIIALSDAFLQDDNREVALLSVPLHEPFNRAYIRGVPRR